ncbi:hypothetical protein [Azotobacter chroococcum]|uniref:hypothetical protein n=1 Tax=Azotobacter chroococcum TaxID=353 RepID=UPI001185B2CF|nr:hypothetical protein [Azotobacter chroococcum]
MGHQRLGRVAGGCKLVGQSDSRTVGQSVASGLGRLWASEVASQNPVYDRRPTVASESDEFHEESGHSSHFVFLASLVRRITWYHLWDCCFMVVIILADSRIQAFGKLLFNIIDGYDDAGFF